MRLPVLLLPMFLVACGGDSQSRPDGAPGDGDAGTQPDARTGPLPTTCTGACSTMTLNVSFGDVNRSFDRAFFGLSAPSQSDSGEWEIYIENNAGDDDACPTLTSPTPQFILTVAGLALPDDASVSGTATLVDFEGALLTDTVFEEASANTLSWTAADVCLACAEGNEADRADRMIAFDIDATFSEGSIAGHSYATHCESLDKLE